MINSKIYQKLFSKLDRFVQLAKFNVHAAELCMACVCKALDIKVFLKLPMASERF